MCSRKEVFLSEKLKNWRAPTTIEFYDVFCRNFAHVSHLPMTTKGCLGFFLFSLDLQNQKATGFFILTETIFINNSRSKQKLSF